MIFIDVFKLILNIIYLPFKLLRVKKKVTFLSRQYDYVSVEYQMIIHNLNEIDKNVKVVTITKRLNKKNIFSYIQHFFLLFKQMYHIATSRVVVTDGYSIPISVLKHKRITIIIQLWHANVIVKKIGLQTINQKSKKKKKFLLKMNMHKHYNYVITSSKFQSNVFEKAFDVTKEQLLNYGTPILDYIYNNKEKNYEEIISKYKLEDKINILYLPTYRTKEIPLNNIIKNIDFKKYNLIMKMHPVMKQKISNKNIIIIDNYPSYILSCVADYVISDYSNAAFEAGLLGKKVLFYIYDYKAYKKEFGLNIDLKKEIKNYCFEDFKELMKYIETNQYDFNKLNSFVEKYIDTFDGESTIKIAKFILKKLEEIR